MATVVTQEPIYLVMPGGRIIWGSTTERATQDYDGKAYEDGKGPFQFGFAVRKDAQGINEVLGALYTQAVNGYAGNAQMAQRILEEYQSGFSRGGFAFKIKDGDRPNQQGDINPNGVGCWVFSMQTSLPIKATHYGMVPGIPNNKEVDPDQIYRGCYCDVNVSAKVNGNLDRTAGIYINPGAVRLLGHGERITGGMSTEQAFGSAPAPVVPVGASSTPVSPSGGAPQVPGQTQQTQPVQAQQYTQPVIPGMNPVLVPGGGGQPAGAPIVPGMNPSATTGYPSNVAPHHAILNPPGQ